MTATTLQAGQWSPALGCAAGAAWWAARRGAWASCGGWLGLIGAFKPYALPVALWVLARPSRARRALLPMAVSATLPFLLGVAVFGLDAHVEWLAQAREIEWLWTAWSASVHGFLIRGYGGQTPSPGAAVPVIVSALGWVLGAGVLAASLWRVRNADPDRAFALLWVASLLSFPLGWVYYGWLAFAPVYALYVRGRLHEPLATRALWLLAYPPALLWMGSERLWSLSVGSVYFWAALGLWLAIWRNRTGDGGA
jgi:hypothetical protein